MLCTTAIATAPEIIMVGTIQLQEQSNILDAQQTDTISQSFGIKFYGKMNGPAHAFHALQTRSAPPRTA